MKKAGAAVLAICGTLGGPAAAASCVGADGETPLPGATGVEIRHADVPSALFGGTWQQGVLDGLAYQIHANGSAIIGDAPAMAGWRLDLTCDPQARRCNRVASGDAPAASAGVAARIEACLLGPAPAAPAAAAKAAPKQAAPEASRSPSEAPRAAADDGAPPAPPPRAAAEPATGAGDASAPKAATDAPKAGASAAAERQKPAPPVEAQPRAAGQTGKVQPPASGQDAAGQASPRQTQEQAGAGRQGAQETPAPVAPDTGPDPSARPAREGQQEPQAGRADADPQASPAPPSARQPASEDRSPPSEARPGSDPATIARPMQLLESGEAGASDTSADVPVTATNRAVPRPRPRPARTDAAPAPPGHEGPAILPLPAERSSGDRPSPDPPVAQTARSRRDPVQRSPGPARSEPRIARTAQPQPATTEAAPRPRQPAAAEPAPPPPAPSPPAPPPPARLRTSCTLGASVALDTGKLSSTMGCTLNYRNRLTFSASMIGYPLDGQKSHGDAEYTYALTWRMTKNLTLTYANYTAAFTGGRGLAGLSEGRLQLSRRLPPVSLPGTTRKLGCSAFASAARRGTENAGLSCGLPLGDKLSLRMTGYLYLPGAQRDSDPDYSYSLSWTVAPQVTLTWSNYANNRWFWNPSDEADRFLRGGSLGLTYGLRF